MRAVVAFCLLLSSSLAHTQAPVLPPAALANKSASCACQHDGLCIDGKCACPNGFAGTSCEVPIRICTDSDAQCNNGGSCRMNDVGQYICKCTEGFTGVTCDVAVKRCSENFACYNGGLCGMNPTGSYFCICPKGFEGITCDIPVTVCSESVSCYNGGMCATDASGSHSCNCLDGFIGYSCESPIDICSDTVYCYKNSGICEMVADGSYTCRCVAYAVGDKCQYNATSVCGDDPWEFCANDGVCQTSGAHCLCPDGFSGDRCEILGSESVFPSLTPIVASIMPTDGPVGMPATTSAPTKTVPVTIMPATSGPAVTNVPGATTFPVEAPSPMKTASPAPFMHVPAGMTLAPVTSEPSATDVRAPSSMKTRSPAPFLNEPTGMTLTPGTSEPSATEGSVSLEPATSGPIGTVPVPTMPLTSEPVSTTSGSPSGTMTQAPASQNIANPGTGPDSGSVHKDSKWPSFIYVVPLFLLSMI